MQNLCQTDSFDQGSISPLHDSLEALPMELSQFCMKVSLCGVLCLLSIKIVAFSINSAFFTFLV